MPADDIASICKNILDQQSKKLHHCIYTERSAKKRYISCIIYIDGERYGKSVKDNIAKELQHKLGRYYSYGR